MSTRRRLRRGRLIDRRAAFVMLPWTAAVIALTVIGFSTPQVDVTWLILTTATAVSAVMQIQVADKRLSPLYVPFSALMAICGPTSAVLIAPAKLLASENLAHRCWNTLVIATMALAGGWAFRLADEGTGGGLRACGRDVSGSCVAYLGWALLIYLLLATFGFLLVFAGNRICDQNRAGYRVSVYLHELPSLTLTAPLFLFVLVAWADIGAVVFVPLALIAGSFTVLRTRLLLLEHREHQLSELTEALRGQREAALATVQTAMESRSRLEALHARRVSELAVSCAEELGLDNTERERIRIAALLHDVGKLMLPDTLLWFEGQQLTDEERQLFEAHPDAGARQLERMPPLADVAALVRSHHERPDGRGYPDGLIGDQIPLGSQIIAVCGAYDAMTSIASYQTPHSRSWARSELQSLAGTRFSEPAVWALLRALKRSEPLESDHEGAFRPNPVGDLGAAAPVADDDLKQRWPETIRRRLTEAFRFS